MSALDGLTLMRYAHMYRTRSGGGVEQYLSQLNRGLLDRHDMTILQMYLAPSTEGSREIEIERCGRGRLVWIPVCHHHEKRSVGSLARRLKLILSQQRFPRRDDTGVNRSHRVARWRSLRGAFRHLRYPGMILSDALVDILDSYEVELLVLHWLSYDLNSVLSSATARGIPYGIVNHFDNRRLGKPNARHWVNGAAGLGGVSSQNVPLELRTRFCNLSDAVDVGYFARHHARPVNRPAGFLVLLPARLVEGKGHRDLLTAVKALEPTLDDVIIAFAGATEIDSEALVSDLRATIARDRLESRVLFLGQLSPSELRDWYGHSEVVALPSNYEGLGKVLLEAQAMEVPVIAYDAGGIPEALVDRRTGFLVKTGDWNSLAEAIKFLHEHPDERKAMGQSGRGFVSSRYSVAALIERHEQFYETLLASPSRARQSA